MDGLASSLSFEVFAYSWWNSRHDRHCSAIASIIVKQRIHHNTWHCDWPRDLVRMHYDVMTGTSAIKTWCFFRSLRIDLPCFTEENSSSKRNVNMMKSVWIKRESSKDSKQVGCFSVSALPFFIKPGHPKLCFYLNSITTQIWRWVKHVDTVKSLI